MKNLTPTVSIIIPCRNERHHIEACLSSALAQEEPQGGFEVIVADGMSDDGTREILARLEEQVSGLNAECSTVSAATLSASDGERAGVRGPFRVAHLPVCSVTPYRVVPGSRAAPSQE